MMAFIFFPGRAIEGGCREKEEGGTRNATSSDNCEAVMNIHLAESMPYDSGFRECEERDRERGKSERKHERKREIAKDRKKQIR